VRLEDASGGIIWASPVDASSAAQVESGRTYVDRLEVTLDLGPGRYFLASVVWILPSDGGALPAFESDRFANAVDLEIQEFELDDDDPIPFWGFADLPYSVGPIVQLPR
jgi:hypothetical protein